MMRSRTPWDWKLLILPFVALVLALILWARPAGAETVQGVTAKGTAYVCELRPPYPLLRFCFMLPADRMARR